MKVDVDSLRTAAARLDQVSAAGVRAVELGGSVAPMDGAFGKMCWALGAALTPVVAIGVHTTSAAVGTSQALAGAARWYADRVEDSDNGVASWFTDLMVDLT